MDLRRRQSDDAFRQRSMRQDVFLGLKKALRLQEEPILLRQEDGALALGDPMILLETDERSGLSSGQDF